MTILAPFRTLPRGVSFVDTAVPASAETSRSEMDRSDPAYRGQRDYNGLVLRLYDPLVLGPIARFVWGCPAGGLLKRYRRHVRDNHLDVGPGTGYFLVHSGLPAGSRVTILDPKADVLRHVSRRLRSFDLTAVQADVLKPLPVRGPFDSAALNLVIHCLPGPLERKAKAVANVAAVLAPTGVLFGASVLGRSGDHNRVARGFLTVFNRQGGFDNLGDTEDGLREILEASFEEVELETIGSAALFLARRPRVSPPSA
jgi:SAM-dependent methyltransferase